MGLCRNTSGRMAYTMTVNKRVFSIHKGENRILRHYPYITTNACIDTGLPLPDEIPRFNSFIQAVRFMKENKDLLR